MHTSPIHKKALVNNLVKINFCITSTFDVKLPLRTSRSAGHGHLVLVCVTVIYLIEI